MTTPTAIFAADGPIEILREHVFIRITGCGTATPALRLFLLLLFLTFRRLNVSLFYKSDRAIAELRLSGVLALCKLRNTDGSPLSLPRVPAQSFRADFPKPLSSTQKRPCPDR